MSDRYNSLKSNLNNNDYADSGNVDDFFWTPQALNPFSRHLWGDVMRHSIELRGSQDQGERTIDFLTPPPFDCDLEPDVITPGVRSKRRTRRVWLH